MRTPLLLAALLVGLHADAQGTFCNPAGNIAIFSNYDGGPLTIRVDQDIPDLHIGIVSYEYATVVLTGPYVGNVVAVHYAGYNGTNDNCGQGSLVFTTTLAGVPSSVAQVVVAPEATYPNSNGWNSIICAYSCGITTGQGGCNTVDQVAHYFLSMWDGALLFHQVQYNCWAGTWNISDGGNCCVDPLQTAVPEGTSASAALLAGTVVRDHLRLVRPCALSVLDGQGRVLLQDRGTAVQLPLPGIPPGTYFLRNDATGAIERFVVAY